MVKAKYHKYLLKLSKRNIAKMHKGEPTMLKHDQLSGGSVEVYMTARQHNKLKKAHEKGKGVKLHLTEHEREHNEKHGEGWKDLLKTGARTLAKEAKPIVKKTVAKFAKKYVGEDAGNAIGSAVADVGEHAVNIATGGKLRKGQHLSGLDATVGGKVDFMKIAKNVSSGYKKYVKNTPIGDAVRKTAKAGLMTAAAAVPTALGAPELAPITTGLANQYGDTLIQKAGLGVLQSNHSNFLNSMHPSMHPHIPAQGITDIPRKGGSFLGAGRGLHGGSFVGAGRGLQYHHEMGMVGGGLGDAMNPLLPKQGISDVARDRAGRPIHIGHDSGMFAGSQ
jgi:hypothetical protein